MIDAYAVPDVRAAERRTMADLPDGELMRRAAAGLAEVAHERLAERGGRRVVALVGPGDNGGDALYAAALLADRYEVAAVLVAGHAHEAGLAAARAAGVTIRPHPAPPAPGAPTPPRARTSAVAFRASEGAETPPTESSDAWGGVGQADLVLDGILGIGGRPGLSPDLEALVDRIGGSAYVLSVDLPSGADPAGREPVTSAVFADETVTFGAAKPVHLLPATQRAVGRLTVVDIGLGLAFQDVGLAPAVQRLTRCDVAARWPTPGPHDDKYSRGVLGVVAGGEAYTGAPVMCVTAAVCAGAGMVRYVGPATPTGLVRSAVPEAVFGEGRVQAWVVGPGLDAVDESPDGAQQVQAARRALASGLACLVDAGGLDLLDPSDLPRTTPTLLTPHAGELSRLLNRLTAPASSQPGASGSPVDAGGCTREQVEADPLRYAATLAGLTGATVLLKGATTLVVPPPADGLPVRAQADAPAWLATAGSGDVLAGLAGMLLAAGLPPLEAGSVAALVHGLSGHAANPGGPVRALAVAHAIPAVVARLLGANHG